VSTLILGIGNNLLSDEGVGCHAIEYLNRFHPALAGVTYMDGGTLSFTLAESLAAADALIVIDAAQLDSEAGFVKMFEGRAMDRFLGENRNSSVHEVGLLELLATSELMGELPRYRALIGIQPGSLDWGEQPTEAVSKAIPRACEMALELVGRWPQSQPATSRGQ
jgi:hydrogenase maturation protease